MALAANKQHLAELVPQAYSKGIRNPLASLSSPFYTSGSCWLRFFPYQTAASRILGHWRILSLFEGRYNRL